MGSTWVEKRDITKQPQVKKLEKDFAGMKAGGLMLVSTPREVDQYIRTIPAGHSQDLTSIRSALAQQHHADYTCPVSTGIFVRIVCEAAFEEYQNGSDIDDITPFWRILPANAPTRKKLSFDLQFIDVMRNHEMIE